MVHPENPPRPDLSGAATMLAANLTRRYKDMALGRARMQLYAALNKRDVVQVDLLAQTCFILMERHGFAETEKIGSRMQDMDREVRLQALSRSMDDLILFAETEGDFLLAAKLDEARMRFVDTYLLAAK